jgi:type I restriction enzyme S subunit
MSAGLQPYPSYRESGLSWLGQVPGHWDVKRAKWLFRKMDRPVQQTDDIVTCFRDGVVTLRKNRRVRGFTEALKEIGYQGIRRGDLVIHAMDAFAGAVGVADSDGKGTPVYSVCEPRTAVSAQYYAYVVREMARSQWIAALSRGIRERSTDFRFDDFASQPVPFPPLPEQVAIVRFLDHADRRIRRYVGSKRRLIALLIEQRQSFIERTLTRGLNPDVRWRPSGIAGLGEIPEHWTTVRNRYLFREAARKYSGEDMPQLSLSQRDGVIETDRMSERSLRTATYDDFKLVVPDDLVLNRFKAHLGVFFASKQRGIITFHYGVFRGVKPLRTKYFELLYHTAPYRAIYAGASNGMTVGLQNLGNQDFYGVVSIVPPLAEQSAIVSAIGSETAALDALVASIERGIGLILEYRARLIADVVAGRVNVVDAAARLPDETDETKPLADVELLVEDDGASDLDIDSGTDESAA